MATNIYHSIIYNRQDIEAAQVSIGRWMNGCVCVRERERERERERNGVLVIKKNGILPFVDNMDGPRGYYPQWNVRQKTVVGFYLNVKSKTQNNWTNMTIWNSGANGDEPISLCRRCKGLGFNCWIEKTPLEEEMATHSSILAWKNPMDRGAS